MSNKRDLIETSLRTAQDLAMWSDDSLLTVIMQEAEDLGGDATIFQLMDRVCARADREQW